MIELRSEMVEKDGKRTKTLDAVFALMLGSNQGYTPVQFIFWLS